ncbi:hypothetical protein FisN_2Hu104 [Fistulifera solaris]|uniref:Uncharacterized protein n=1 Tax=Fistulifera solaris TaxID=1519565 RepID=A0A1Z5KQ61_FISSO|nr:hypothetical protein FisN_2Hu104 [Fistulifera solaris]|eukprot:GAX28078.1 hypothetical protein FisN_2Hu104 [Fistulifera solaris]
MKVHAAMGLKPHIWLSFYHHIGGERCLLNTHKIVRMMLMFCSTKHKGRMAVIDPELLGTPFDENKRPARRILGDLDEPFLSSIIPELAAICKLAPFETLPNRSYLITLIDLLHRQVKSDPTKPVPVASTFGFHAIATSIYVLQGQGDLSRLASSAKQSFDMMFEQLNTVADRNRTPGFLPKFYDFVRAFSEISKCAKSCYFFKDDDVQQLEEQKKAVMLAFWNPLIAGEYMLYVTYICSINFGSITVNSTGQLKLALHLYNGLKLHNPKVDVPFLRTLDTTFMDAKAVWVGGKAGKGSCYKAFWMSFGMSASQASRLVTSGHEDNIQRFLDEPKNWTKELSDSAIRPESFSSSYRRLVLQDFGSVNNTSTGKHDSFVSDLRSRISVVQESINDDKDHVLPLNFTVVGSILLEFVNALIEHMGLSAKMQESVRNTPALLVAREKALNVFDVNMKFRWMLHSLAHILSSIDKGTTENLAPEFDLDKIAAITESFFDGIKPSRYAFFVDEEETVETVTPRNPLEVSYPYGRTGRTPNDPLQAYKFCRRNRRGNWMHRYIIPGSLAPPISGTYVYNGENKMKRGPRGKCRHIASYSLQELIDLNWDGSLYLSKTAGGLPVPFIHGYDSESDDEYEPIDIERAKREGTIGSSVGLYVLTPDGVRVNGAPAVVQLAK